MINEKVKRKPVPTPRYTAEMASEWFDPQAKKKMNYDDMRAGNLQMKRTSFRFLVLSISQAEPERNRNRSRNREIE